MRDSSLALATRFYCCYASVAMKAALLLWGGTIQNAKHDDDDDEVNDEINDGEDDKKFKMNYYEKHYASCK